jgi:hypothetical protein
LKEIDIAMICHEANRALCLSQGDNSQPRWGEAPVWQVDSAIAGVMFHLDHPGSNPEDSHNAWLKQKEADGWKYGATKDPEKKEHPCFVPFTELPREQQAKDHLFLAIVRAMEPFIA